MINKINVVIVMRFKLHYRINLYERINSLDDINLTLLYGKGIESSKYFNYSGSTNFHNEELKTWHYTRGGKFVSFFPGLFRKLVKLKPDVIITEGESNMINNISLYFYSFLFKKKVIWWSLGLVPGNKESTFQRLYRPLMKFFLKRSSFILGYSEYSKTYYSQFIDSNKIIVTNNCLDNEKIDKEIELYKDQARDLKLSTQFKDKFVILYVGGFAPTKRVDKLILSFKEIKSRFPDTTLVIVGTGDKQKEIFSMVESMSINDVVFTGQVIDEVSKYFLLADLFVLPGVGGLSIHHAMVHSLAVISARADGTERDLVKDNVNGFILKTDTTEELTDCLNRFLVDRKLAKEFGDKSREIVEKQINIQHMVSEFHFAIKNSI